MTRKRAGDTRVRAGDTRVRAKKAREGAGKGRARPVPDPRLALLACLPLALSGAGIVLPVLQAAAIAADLAILAVCAFDLALVLLHPPLSLSFAPRYAFALGRPAAIGFGAVNPGRRRAKARIVLDLPDEFAERSGAAELDAAPGERVEASFGFRPARRGEYGFPLAHVRLRSPLGLFWAQRELEAGCTVSVVPDIGPARGYLRAARAGRSAESGLHPALRRGGESELDYLREYRPDDDPRRIDWKASCRLGRPVSKVLRSETARNVLFMLDSGRLMTAEQGGLSSMDHAVNSVLMLSRVALEMGDSVSVIAFSGTIRGETPFARGHRAIRGISSFLSGLEADLSEPNFEQAFDFALRRLRKRSLVIVVSDMADDLNAEILASYFAALSRRHLPLLALLRDSRLEDWADSGALPGEPSAAAYSRAAAREMALERAKAVSLLRARGLAVLDSKPRELSAAMADKYLELKSRGMV